ncbi:MAG: triose-phosphate isomerase [Planctomycetota bacterium]|jgi:triosephosphate isomerase|nr:triose-phosphate isomerase [Planctomycetota bacterium]
MSRPKYIAGNWKMHLTKRRASTLARDVVAAVDSANPAVKIAVFPTFVHLDHVRRNIKNSNIILGAQNCYGKKEGAFTGEISPYMLRDMGVKVVMLGHSERRHVFGETDDMIFEKVKIALRAKIDVMLCVGETIEERRAGDTFKVLAKQLKVLKVVKPTQTSRVTVAYEPVWAIGTGETATPQIAQEAHAECRRLVGEILGEEAAADIQILYGGSMNGGNAANLLSQPDVDGGLVGGASLSAANFSPIIDAASASS